MRADATDPTVNATQAETVRCAVKRGQSYENHSPAHEGDALMKNLTAVVAIATLMLCVTAFGQQSSTPGQQAQSPAAVKPCVIVEHEGGHTLRNVMLLGVVGAVISKERYKVIESNVAGLKPGEKMHGDELQARTQGTKVVVMGKKEGIAEAREACNATPAAPAAPAASATPAASLVQAK